MKKRNMRLASLLLSIMLTFTSVVPTNATAMTADKNFEVGTESEKKPILSADDGNMEAGEESGWGDKEGVNPDQIDGNKHQGNEDVDNEFGEVNQEETNSNSSTDLSETEGDKLTEGQPNGSDTPGIDDKEETTQQILDSNWTIEKDAEKIIYRKYSDANTKTGFIEKWVYSVADAIWTWYKTDEPEAESEIFEEGIYQVGVVVTVGNDDEVLLENLIYWLDAEGKVQTGWKLYSDENGTEYYYYFGEDGRQDITKTGIQLIGEITYYLKDDFSLLKNDSIVVNGRKYIFDENGKCIKDYIPLKEGWIKDNRGWRWQYDDGSYAQNTWKEIKGKTYYFDNNNYMKYGWVRIEDKWYYFGTVDDGAVKKGWEKVKNKWYYFSPDDGSMITGWQDIDSKRYYLGAGEDGARRYGWQKLNDIWYYFGENDDGAMKTGWQKVGNKWYYLLPEDGSMQSGWQKINNKWYYLSGTESGAMKTGWQKLNSKWYYFGSSNDGGMKTSWQKINNKWFLFNGSGVMQSGWHKIVNKWYYFGGAEEGRMRTGWQKLNDKWYYFGGSNDGAMKTSWQKVNNKWYLLSGSGVMQSGWHKVATKWYYFGGSSDGAMKTGWRVIKNKRYYFGGADDGAMKIGWQNVNGKYYYFGGVNDGSMKTGWLKLDNKWYYLQNDGARVANDFARINGKRYYFNNDGIMLTGWDYVNGYKLYFNSSGALVQDLSNMIGGPYQVRVNRTTCMITIFAKDGENGYIIPVKSITCSVGLPATPTPTGTYYLGVKDRWHILMGPSWGQYTTHVVNGIFIHSVAGSRQSIYNLNAVDYNNLGSPASHGCIRVCVRDAKWIYNNVNSGSQITIGDNYYEPYDKPETIKLAAGTNLMDPTQE